MDDGDAFLAGRFDIHRERLRAVALRMLRSERDAEEALNEARGAGLGGIDDWLTTAVARVCVERLRARRCVRGREASAARPERAARGHGGLAEGVGLADGGLARTELAEGVGLADGVLAGTELADGVGLALFMVLESLAPDERLAFVLHDLFALPLPEVARLTGRTTPEAARLVRGARRHVRGVGGSSGTEESGADARRHRAAAD